MGEIRFVGTGETRGYPYLVCKKNLYRDMEDSDWTVYENADPFFTDIICCQAHLFRYQAHCLQGPMGGNYNF